MDTRHSFYTLVYWMAEFPARKSRLYGVFGDLQLETRARHEGDSWIFLMFIDSDGYFRALIAILRR